jgi:hypothetical protein
MKKMMKSSGLTAVLTTLLAALTACTTTNQPNQRTIQPTNPPTNEPTLQPTSEPERPSLDLPDQGEAPEILNEVWVNANAPVTLANSRGKVVLLEFWTFG